MRGMKYKVYFKDGTTEECDELAEISGSEYRLSTDNSDYDVLIDEVEKIDLIKEPDDKLGCTIDDMAIGLEPNKAKHITKGINAELKDSKYEFSYNPIQTKELIVEQEKDLIDMIIDIYINKYNTYEDYYKKATENIPDNCFTLYIPIMSEELFNYIKSKEHNHE